MLQRFSKQGGSLNHLFFDRSFSRPPPLDAFRGARPRRIIGTTLTILLPIEFILVLMHFVSRAVSAPFDKLQLWFDLDREQSVASWFSSSQLMIVGLLLLLAAWWRWHDRSERLLLAVAGAGFLFLSLDEAVMIHERITGFTVQYAMVPRFPGNHGVWIFAYGAIGLALALTFLKDMLDFLRRRTTVALLMAGGFVSLLLGAVAVELMMYYGIMAGPAQTAIEETLEMVGGSVMICGALVLVDSIVPALLRPPASSAGEALREQGPALRRVEREAMRP